MATLQVERAQWERRVALLRSDNIDPDMLDERARALLDYVDPADVIMMIKPRTRPAADPPGLELKPLVSEIEFC